MDPATSAAARRRQAGLQVGRVLAGIEGGSTGRHERAGVHPGIHPEEGDPGLCVGGEDRRGNGRRAAVAGKERGVQVQDPLGRQVEHRRGEDPAVVGQDAHGRAERGQRLQEGRVPQPLRGEQGQAHRRRPRGHRGGRRLGPPPGRAGRSRDDGLERKLRRRGHRLEDRDGERAGPEEDRPGARHVSRGKPPWPSGGRFRDARARRRPRRRPPRRRRGRPGSARPAMRGSRRRASPAGDPARAAAPGPAGRPRRPCTCGRARFWATTQTCSRRVT